MSALLATAVIAIVYLAVVRLVDLNEKEPLWAVALLFTLGAVAAALAVVLVPPELLELSLVPGVLAKELARFLAIGAGVAALTAVGQARGWSEINGLMDGVVYGAAGGLGCAIGAGSARELTMMTELPGMDSGVADYAEVALAGLGDGLFGALIGIGFAAALEARSALGRVVSLAAGYVAAVLADLAYLELWRGASLEDGALARKWAALAIPVVVVVATAVVALRNERRAIREELAAEVDTGAASADDLALLNSAPARQLRYLKLLARGAIRAEQALRHLHNRQVQLALSKRRAAAERDATRRLALGEEVARLRQAVLAEKRALEERPG